MAFPEAPILDDFNRANEQPVTGWTNVTGAGGMRVVSNGMTGDSVTWCRAFWNQSFSAPFEWRATVSNVSAGYVLDLWYLTNDGNNNGYRLLSEIPGIGSVRLQRMVSGGGTALADFSWTLATGDSFGVRVDGSGAHYVYAKAAAGSWTLLGIANDSTYTSGYVALGTAGDGAAIYDDFAAGYPVLPTMYVTARMRGMAVA